MILRVADYPSIKTDIDLSKLKEVAFFIAKVKAISTSDYDHQVQMAKDARKILVILKQEFAEFFV